MPRDLKVLDPLDAIEDASGSGVLTLPGGHRLEVTNLQKMHRAPDRIPTGVRVEAVTSETETRAHLIGGSLVTLLYTAQLASISQDPCLQNSRGKTLASAYSARASDFAGVSTPLP